MTFSDIEASRLAGRAATQAALDATHPEAAAAYRELTSMTPDEKRDRQRVQRLTRVIDAAHIDNGIRRIPGYQITLDGTAIQAPDSSTYGPNAIKRYTGSRQIPGV